MPSPAVDLSGPPAPSACASSKGVGETAWHLLGPLGRSPRGDPCRPGAPAWAATLLPVANFGRSSEPGRQGQPPKFRAVLSRLYAPSRELHALSLGALFSLSMPSAHFERKTRLEGPQSSVPKLRPAVVLGRGQSPLQPGAGLLRADMGPRGPAHGAQ